MSLVHPSTSALRRENCLTPIVHEVKPLRKHELVSRLSSSTILSPPLSPFQTDDDMLEFKTEEAPSSSYSFQLEDFKPSALTFQPWKNLNKEYKKKHLDFLLQYTIPSSREIVLERRVPIVRRRPLISDSESESTMERIRTRRVARETPDFGSDSETTPRSLSPSVKKRKVKKEGSYTPKQVLIDENIPDYSPNASTLPNNRCLKVEWKGQPMDLRSDPDVSKLHPAEVLLASTLRLPANIFLDSKRRLFYEKVNRLRTNKQFRRTDAQKACRIDVNKASRLFAAFEKVGWLEDHHFKSFL